MCKGALVWAQDIGPDLLLQWPPACMSACRPPHVTKMSLWQESGCTSSAAAFWKQRAQHRGQPLDAQSLSAGWQRGFCHAARLLSCSAALAAGRCSADTSSLHPGLHNEWASGNTSRPATTALPEIPPPLPFRALSLSAFTDRMFAAVLVSCTSPNRHTGSKHTPGHVLWAAIAQQRLQALLGSSCCPCSCLPPTHLQLPLTSWILARFKDW